MKFEWTTFIGLIAAFCTTWAFLPQVLKTIKSRDTKAISLSMYIILTFGVFLWLLYGIIIGDLPLIIANSITFFLSTIVLVFKIKYK